MRLPVYALGKEDFAISVQDRSELFYFTKATYIPSSYTIFIYSKEEISGRDDLELLPMSIENILLFEEERESNTYYGVISKTTGTHYTFEEFRAKYAP